MNEHGLTNLGGYQERLSLLAKHRNTEHEVLQKKIFTFFDTMENSRPGNCWYQEARNKGGREGAIC
jgi:hypothetical protein